MSDQPRQASDARQVRRALWASTVFYALIAFEFFYMATPFAAYLYAVYGPGLDWLEGWGATGWAIRFFLPHIVAETRSPLVDAHQTVGMVLFCGGLAGFAIGAFQIYRAKLRRADAVMGGLYRYIRHPQYLALIVASIGMVLIWPRYLVLVATVSVIFVYVALARVEEGICRRRFAGYEKYMQDTGMFLPLRAPRALTLPAGAGRAIRAGAWLLAYAAALGLALLAASALRAHVLDSLYVLEVDGATYLSVAEIADGDLEAAAHLARSSAEAQAALAGRERLLNYVVPTGMYISEIPMTLPPGAAFGHSVPADADPALYKVVFTEPVFDAEGLPEGGDVVGHAVNKRPLIEVHVDLDEAAVTATFTPPADAFYDGRQVPVF